MIFSLAQYFHDALAVMPPEHPKHRMLGLLEEAIRLDIHFIDRHPTTLFQCIWNSCRWFDQSLADEHYDGPAAVDGSDSPRVKGEHDQLICRWIESWRVDSTGRGTQVPVIDSLRPRHMGTGSWILRGHQNCVCALAIAPGVRLLASGSWDGSIRLWDRATWREVNCLKGHKAEVNAIAFVPYTDFLVSGSSDCSLRVWDMCTQALTKVISIPPVQHMGWQITGVVTAIAVSRDGERMATAIVCDGFAAANEVLIWNTRFWGVECRFPAARTPGGEKGVPIRALAFSPDGTRLFGGTGTMDQPSSMPGMQSDSCALVWDLLSSAESLPVCLAKFDSVVWAISLSQDGRQLLAGSEDGSVSLIEVPISLEEALLLGTKSERLRPSDQPVNGVVFSPDGRSFAVALGDGTTRLFDTATRRSTRTVHGHDAWVASVVYSEDGKTVVTGSSDSTIRVSPVSGSISARVLRGHTERIQQIAVSPAGGQVASSSNDATVDVWDTESGLLLHALRHGAWVEGLAWSGAGTMLASGGADKIVRIWEPASGRETVDFVGHQDHVSHVLFYSGDQRLASASRDKTVRTWDVQALAPLCILDAGAVPWCVAVSPDGAHLAAGNALGLLRIWDAETWRLLHEFNAEGEGVTAAAFSLDGELVAGGTERGSVYLWETKTGRGVSRLDVDPLMIAELRFARDGHRLVVVSGNIGNALFGTSSVWDLRSFTCMLRLPGFVDGSELDDPDCEEALLVTGTGSQVVTKESMRFAGYWPERLHMPRRIPYSRSWAGSIGAHVCLLRFNLAQSEAQ